jgi:ankyrin repeat protein
MLINAGADVNQAKDNGCSPVFIAAQKNHMTVLATLLKAGADVNSRKDDGCTPLCIAAHHGHEGVLVALLEGGAQMTAMDNGWTPLMAASHGRGAHVRSGGADERRG